MMKRLLQFFSTKKKAEEKTSTTTTTSSSSPKVTTTISDLPQLAMLRVFDFLPLSKLQHIDEVCSGWQAMKPVALHRRHHLVITEHLDDLELLAGPGQYAEHCLLRFVLEEKEKREEEEEEGKNKDSFFRAPYYTTLLTRFDRHAFYLDDNQPLHMETLDRSKLLPNPTAILDRVREQQLLTKLTVFHLVLIEDGSPEDLEKVTQLLDHYRQQLEEVTIVFRGGRDVQLFDPNCPEDVEGRFVFRGGCGRLYRSKAEVGRLFQEAFTSLMGSLNKLEKLRRLEVNFRAAPGYPVVIADDQLVQHSLPDVVGRLEKLVFRTRLKVDWRNREAEGDADDARLLKQVLVGMRDAVGAAAAAKTDDDKTVADGADDDKKVTKGASKQQNNSCLQVYIPGTPLTLQTLISLGPGPVAAGLRSVQIEDRFSDNSKEEYEALAQFIRQSPHLAVLKLKVKRLSIWRLLEALTPLQELYQLYIQCGNDGPPQEKVDDADQLLPVLPTVKSLLLDYASLSHLDYQHLHLEAHFPNLEMIEWTHTGRGCTECGFEIPTEVLNSVVSFFLDNGRKFQAAYGLKQESCLSVARMIAFHRLHQLVGLWMNIRPANGRLHFNSRCFRGGPGLLHPSKAVNLDHYYDD